MTTSSPQLRFFSFVSRCFSRAFSDTLTFFKLKDVVGWARMFVPPVITFFVLWYLVGPDSVSKQVSGWITAGIASFSWALMVLAAHLIIAPYRLHRDLTARIAELESSVGLLKEAQTPRLAIRFESRDTYVQGVAPHFLYRISVENLSLTRSLESVTVELANIKPFRPPVIPVRLHLMHDNPPDQVYQQSFDLTPGESRYIDVLEVHKNVDGVRFAIKHIVRNIAPYFAEQVEVLTIVARAKDCPSASADFILREQDGVYKFSMKP